MNEIYFQYYLKDEICEEAPPFKSRGEKKIADFLESVQIEYQYEKAVLLDSYDGMARIWYPDFYLPEFKTYIEYYGMSGSPNYDQGIKVKEMVYSKKQNECNACLS